MSSDNVELGSAEGEKGNPSLPSHQQAALNESRMAEKESKKKSGVRSSISMLICKNCSGSGHYKRNCPQIRCKLCGELGHFQQDCGSSKRLRVEEMQLQENAPTGKIAAPSDPSRVLDVCHRCGSSRHEQSSCPVRVSIACKQCHQEGHVITKCPQTRCFNCGAMGHSSQICQSKIHCFHCSVVGHDSAQCPIKHRGRVCYQCKEPGHEAANCPQGVICRMCHLQGHIIANCPSIICGSCHQKGHMSTACQSKNPPLATTGGEGRDVAPLFSSTKEMLLPPSHFQSFRPVNGLDEALRSVIHKDPLLKNSGDTSPPILLSPASTPGVTENFPIYEPTSTRRNGRVVVVIDGPYFERCIVGHDVRPRPASQYKRTTLALKSALAYIGDIFEMEPIAYWFDTSIEDYVDFIEKGMPLRYRDAAFRELSLRRQYLIDEMNSTTGKLSNVVARLVGTMKRQRGYTPDGPGHVWVQSGVDVAIATCLVEHFYQDSYQCSQVVLLSGDSDIYPAVKYCNTIRKRFPLASIIGASEKGLDSQPSAGVFPPVRVCGTSSSLSREFGLHQDLFDFLPRIFLNEKSHKETGRNFEFSPYKLFV